MFRFLKYSSDGSGGGGQGQDENNSFDNALTAYLDGTTVDDKTPDNNDGDAIIETDKPENKPSDDKPEPKEPVIEPVEGAYLDTRTIVNGKIEGSVYKTKEEFVKGQQELLAHKARVEASDRQAREELARIMAENAALKAAKPTDDPTDALNKVFENGEDEDDVIDENDPTYKRIFKQLNKTLEDPELAKSMAWAQTIGAREEAKRYVQGQEKQQTEKQKIAEQQQAQVKLIETVNEAATKYPDLLLDVATGAELEKQNIDESHPDYQKLLNTNAFYVMVTSGLSKEFALRKIAGEQQGRAPLSESEVKKIADAAEEKARKKIMDALGKKGIRLEPVASGDAVVISEKPYEKMSHAEREEHDLRVISEAMDKYLK